MEEEINVLDTTVELEASGIGHYVEYIFAGCRMDIILKLVFEKVESEYFILAQTGNEWNCENDNDFSVPMKGV